MNGSLVDLGQVVEGVVDGGDDDARNHTEAKVVRGLKRALWQRDRDRAANPALPDLTCLYMPPLGGGRDLNDLVRVTPAVGPKDQSAKEETQSAANRSDR